MKEIKRPALRADAEVATALKALLIVLLSTVLLPRVLPLPLSTEKEEQRQEEEQPQTLQDSIQQLEIFPPGNNDERILKQNRVNRRTFACLLRSEKKIG